MKKATLLLTLVSILMVSCAKDDLRHSQDYAGIFPTFYASLGDETDADTKTYIDSKMKLRWTKGDSLSIFVGNTYNHKYKFDGETGANNGSFSAITSPEFIAAEPLDANYAIYPYNASNEMSSDGSMSVILPSVQKYAQNSFGLGANTMVAATENKEDNFLQFKNLCGYVVVKLYGEGTVTSIKLEGNDGEKISGKADVQAAFGTLPSVTMSEEATTSITLDCGEGVALGTTAETATEFWLCVPPVTFSKGFTVTATKDDGWQMIKSTSSSKEVVRNTKNALTPIEAVFDQKPDNSAVLAQEREALIAIYNALDGDNWTNNENWCSNKPVGEWEGVITNASGVVEGLYLYEGRGQIPDDIGNLSHLRELTFTFYVGNEATIIPESIGQLTNLTSLTLIGPNIFGCIPMSIGNLRQLEKLDIDDTNVSGSIPESIGNLTKLNYLYICFNPLLKGSEIPSSFGNLSNLKLLSLRNNGLAGNVPETVMKLDIWKYDWANVLLDNNLNRNGLIIPEPTIQGTTLSGNYFDSSKDCSPNDYWVLIQWSAQYDGYFDASKINAIYSKYSDKVKMIGLTNRSRDTKESVQLYIEQQSVLWDNIFWDDDDRVVVGMEPAVGDLYHMEYAGPCHPSFFVFHNGVVAYYDINVYDGISGLDEFLQVNVLGETPDYYISSDFSADGIVHTVQTATIGNGVNVVLMGDAFSDRQIADGTYNNVMQKAVNALFSEEPYKSYKDYFNVYTVDAVSMTEGYEHGGQVFSTGHGGGTYVYGNDNKVFEYAQKALTVEQMDDALIIVMMNEDAYAGTCFMYAPNSGDYGRGSSIAYFPTSSDIDTFNGLVSHEAGGHGFAKLADEYAYEDMGTISDQAISDTKQMEPYGWWKNVDFTSDPTQVKWSKFLSDERYANEGLGCFEGGLTYWSGVWRPTDYSIMRYNTGGFNAPSREAIWYRIHKLAYGEDWEYNYEDFVAYDAINRTPAAQAASRAKVKAAAAARKGKPFQPLHEPVVVKRSWKDAVNNPGKDGR